MLGHDVHFTVIKGLPNGLVFPLKHAFSIRCLGEAWGGMCSVHWFGLPGEEGICMTADKTKHLWPFSLITRLVQRLCTLLGCYLKRDLLARLTVLT